MDIKKEEIAHIRKKLSTEYQSSSKASLVSHITWVIFFLIPIISILKLKNSYDSPYMMSFFGPTLIGLIILVLVQFVYVRPRTNKYQDSVKKVINSLVFERMFENVIFTPKKGIPQNEMKSSALIPLGNRYSSNDHLKGKKDGVDFERSDVWTYTESTDSNGNTTRSTDFKGQVYKFNFHKDTLNYVQIKDKRFLSGVFKGHMLPNVHKITMESSRFNDQFDVYTDNEEEAFYVFTPHFMEKTMKLRNKFNSKLSIVVTKGIIYIAVNTGRDSFEIKNNQEVSDQFIREVIEEANIINKLITELNLDSDLFRER